MRAWHWILLLMVALAPPALYASVAVAAAAFGYWKATKHPPTLTMVYVDRAVPSGAPSAPTAPNTPTTTAETPR